MTRRFFEKLNTIQVKLVVMFLISVFVTLAIVIGFNQAIRLSAIDSANASLLLKAENLARTVDEFHRRNMQSFAVASTSPQLNQFYALSEEERQNEEMRELVVSTLQTFQPQPFNQFQFTSFALLDLDGNNLIDTNADLEGRYEGYFEYVDPPQTVASYVSSVIFEPDSAGTFFYYSVPIRTFEEPHTLVGVMRAQMSISTLQNLILENIDDSLHAVLLDENDLRLLDSRQPQYRFRSIRQYDEAELASLQSTMQIPSLSATQLAEPLPSVATHITELHDSLVMSGTLHVGENKPERIAVVPLETVDFKLLLAQEEAVFLQPVRRQSTGTLLLTLVLTTGAISIAVAVARSLNQPLAELTQVAQQAREGNLDVRARVFSDDEVGILAHAFNEMIAELQQNKDTLEDRIEERRQELQAEIEARNRLEAENLLESERKRILADFIQNVSHEFKTPLSIINMQSYLMLRSTDEADEQLMSRIQRINDQSHNIETLVNEMVMMARLDNEMMGYVDENIQVTSLVRAIETSERPKFDEQNLTFEVNSENEDVYFRANSYLVTDAIQCVLKNALDNTDAGGTVTLSTRVRDGQVCFIIRDTGIGIADEHIPHVFERFYRVDNARTTRGFGLGLPIAQRIIERYKGTITLSSVLGEGTSVEISFPLISKQALETKTQSHQET